MWLPPLWTRSRCFFCLCAVVPLGGGHGVLEGACGEGLRLEEMIREYEGAVARPRGAIAPRGSPGRGLREQPGAPISVEVFFLSTCPHCYKFVKNSLVPFLDAELPGDEVVVTLLPLLKGMSSSDSCKITDACLLSLAPLCALKDTLPQPAPVNSEALRKAGSFVECDLKYTAMQLGRDEDATKSCSDQAGILWSGDDGLQTCFEGREAFDIMYSTDYADSVVSAMHRLTEAMFTEPPGMPWVFVDGQLLACEESGVCRAVPGFKSSGDPVEGSGSLLELVCDRIGDGDGKEQCDRARASDRHEAREDSHPEPAQIAQCENCYAVGGPRWGLRGQAGWAPAAFVSAAVLCVLAAAAGLALRLARRLPVALGASSELAPLAADALAVPSAAAGAAAAAREGAALFALERERTDRGQEP